MTTLEFNKPTLEKLCLGFFLYGNSLKPNVNTKHLFKRYKEKVLTPLFHQDMAQISDKEFITKLKKFSASYFEVTVEELEGKSRKEPLPDYRFMLYAIIKSQRTTTLKGIGLWFMGRDHSTILHGLDKFADLYITDKKFKTKFNALETYLKELNIIK